MIPGFFAPEGFWRATEFLGLTVRRRLSVCVLVGDYVSTILYLVTVEENSRLEQDGRSPLPLTVDPFIYIHLVPLIFAVRP